MPKRPKVLELPQELRAWLDQALIANGFADYGQLATALKAQGHQVGKSSLQRYGSVLEKRLATLKVATDQAKAIVQASPDDEGAMNEALIRLTQEKLFGVLLEMDVDPATVNLVKLTKSIADVARSSVTQRKWAAIARQELLEEQRKKLEAMPTKGGVTPETKAAIREALGIV
jgi:hypothetical protein